MEEYRVTVQEAARRLGVQDQAIRKRIKRGTIRSDKDKDGRVYVYLSTDRTEDAYADRDELVEAKDETIAELRARIDSLERRLDRSDRLLAAALERIPPQLGAPRDEQNQAESAESRSDKVERPPPVPDAAESRSEPRRGWFGRIFGRR